jgi:hypothetical protein
MIQLLNPKFFNKIKNFRKVLLLDNVKETINAEKILKKNKILVLGYYMQNVFFFKKDFDFKKTEKKYLFDHLRSRIATFFFVKKKIISNLKFLFIKLILLLKKRDINQ